MSQKLKRLEGRLTLSEVKELLEAKKVFVTKHPYLPLKMFCIENTYYIREKNKYVQIDIKMESKN